MQSSCMHICHCGDTAAQQAAPAPASNARQGEWIWSTSDGFAANTCDLEYAFAADSDNFLGLSAYSTPTTSTLAGTRAKPDGAGSATTWLPQNETVDGLWGASAFVDMDLLPAGMAIDLDLSIPSLAQLGAHDVTATPNSRHDSLPTPGLTHSPASARTYEALPAVGFSAHTASSVGSAPSVPATPTNPSLIETDSLAEQNKQTAYQEMLAAPAHGLASAFDFTNSPQTTTTTQAYAHQHASIATQASQARACVCSASLTRTATSTSHMDMAAQVAIPAPGWLNPESVSVLAPVEPYASTLAPPPSVLEYSEWSDAGTGGWMMPATCPINTRYEPYRTPSVASTASSSSQSFLAEPSGSRRRSLTVGSLPSAASCVVDRVRMIGACRAPSPGVQRSLPASPRLSASKKFNSMPCRRIRAPAAATSTFPPEVVESASLVDRRMASLSARSRSNTPHRGLASLFTACDAFIEPAEASPALLDLSLGLNTPTSSTFSRPCTPTLASIGAKQDGEGEEGRAKIAMHHHRTKLQRAVLNEVVTSLQSAYKHCRRQHALDSASELAGELLALQLQDHDGWQDGSSSASVVVAGETREMRKNRQKAESKMRMRRKEIQQFAALVRFAQLAASPTTPEPVVRSLLEVLAEHRESWCTLMALEKRLFHAVRDKLGLTELVVKKLLEQWTPPPTTDGMLL
ncbi:hypothetical protein PaG_06244 [Moesziomyces aphidis]|uniref:Uncharacterized protein n=1 Tax=Moesziomyces aphidis TaxID=84754 RepID=W3VG24_MOEAP|nr:hypothetical protein PaG_06244 [Moesziomyces aphidis]